MAHARVFVYVRVCSHYQSIHRRPELFPVLQGSLASPNTIVQARAALTIRHVTTELSSKVLFTNRVEFQTVQRTMPSIDIEYDGLEAFAVRNASTSSNLIRYMSMMNM